MGRKEAMSTAISEPDTGLSYTLASVKAIDAVQRRAGELIRKLAESRAKSAHRDVVTANDIIECIAEALRETITEANESIGGQ